MDEDTKMFFEKLTGSGSDDTADFDEEKETLVKKPVAKKAGRPSKKKIAEAAETAEEQIEINEEPPKFMEEKNVFDELFDESEGELAIDVYSTPTALVIESAIAGVKPEDIDVSINPESVTIRGKRERTEKIKTENYIHQECYWGRFSRTIILPQEVDPDKSHANIKNGVLKVTLQKADKEKTKKIKIKFE